MTAWPDFVENMNYEDKYMLTQEEIDNWNSGYEDEHKKQFEKVRPDLEKALSNLESAIHYFHETGDCEYQILDEIFGNIYDAQVKLNNLLGDT